MAARCCWNPGVVRAPKDNLLALPLRRWAVFLAVLLTEGLILGVRFDSDALVGLPDGWWTAAIRNAGMVVRFGSVMLAAALLVAGARASRGLPPSTMAALREHRWAPYLITQLACFGALAALSPFLFHGVGEAPPHARALIGAWFGALALTLVTWMAAIVPPLRWPSMMRMYGRTAVDGLLVGVAAALAGWQSQRLWSPLQDVTLRLSSGFLRAFVPDAVVDAANATFGVRDFIVDVAPQCAGYEGLGLIGALLLAALWLFRDRFRFPRALWLLGIGTTLAFALNIVRMSGLVLVGAYLSPAIGAGGFHSYAASLLFCAVALAMVAAALRWPWLARAGAPDADHRQP